MTDFASRDSELRTVSDPVWRILTGAAAFGAGVFVCGSVGSYAPTDPSWNAATSAALQNLFGGAGAIFADLARQTLGWSGWIAGVALMIGGAMRAVLVGQPRIRRWVMGVVSVPLSAACFAAWPVPESWPLSAGLGGMAGDGLFHLTVLPFRALMLPTPETWAAFLLGGARSGRRSPRSDSASVTRSCCRKRRRAAGGMRRSRPAGRAVS
jgi:DNA segregation ATPase FtsK/SpoIIIE, S-DNA-T family